MHTNKPGAIQEQLGEYCTIKRGTRVWERYHPNMDCRDPLPTVDGAFRG